MDRHELVKYIAIAYITVATEAIRDEWILLFLWLPQSFCLPLRAAKGTPNTEHSVHLFPKDIKVVEYRESM